jgi:hypothetical protein
MGESLMAEMTESVTIKNVIVYGDIARDCHLYGGTETGGASMPGATYLERWGGAALTYDLLLAASDTEGRKRDIAEARWEKENGDRVSAGEERLPEPKLVKEPRPVPSYATHLALKCPEDGIPSHLRSYSTWSGHRENKGSTDLVWRMKDDIGYGAYDKARRDFVYSANEEALSVSPALTIIDDGNILFRQPICQNIWPKTSGGGWYLMKMSYPLGVGDLWADLEAVMDRLILVVSAEDLRRANAQINGQLSWERCAEDTLEALRKNPAGKELTAAKHIIVSFGSAGAVWATRQNSKNDLSARLVFDPRTLEGDYSDQFEGKTYGLQTCFLAGIAHHLMKSLVHSTDPAPDIDTTTMDNGIVAGISARRMLLEHGHGSVASTKPGIPIDELGTEIAGLHRNIVSVDAPCPKHECEWTILQASERCEGDDELTPLWGPAELLARYGSGVLADVPALKMGSLFTVDRSEIESLRTIHTLIKNYEDTKVQKKPLSIGVFGPPGAGKSFGVKAIARSVLDKGVPILEFNLSQFKSPEELIGAFHRVRDAVLEGVTPVAFWDEFDSQEYKWLQYLLAPMQDGSFQEGQITHPIGKCIFIFAGGTSDRCQNFGLPDPDELALQSKAKMKKGELDELAAQYRKFKLLKGPDFISRLHGFLNVLGPNPQNVGVCADLTWPVRRAILLRGLLNMKDGQYLDIDPGLLNALLNVSEYRHGARSLEKIVRALESNKVKGILHRSALPPMPLLERETKAEEFHDLVIQRDLFRNFGHIDALAAVEHARYVDVIKDPSHEGWEINPSIMEAFRGLPPDLQDSNRATARRIPDHLALIGYAVEPWKKDEGNGWEQQVSDAIEKHMERLAQAEHYGWCQERISNGWTFGKPRNNALKRHDLLVDWRELNAEAQDKDRGNVRAILSVLKEANYKAVRRTGSKF